MKLRGDLDLYRRVFQQARPHWGKIAGIFCLDLLSSPLGLLTPLPLKIAVDSAIGSHPLPGFLQRIGAPALQSRGGAVAIAVAMLITLAILAQLQNLASSLLRTYTAEKLLLDFRARVFRHVQRMSLSYHDTIGTADSVYRIQYDTASIQYISIEGLIPFVTSATTLVAMLCVTTRIDWHLTLVAVTISPILLLLSQAYRPRLRQKSRRTKDLEHSALAVVQEVLQALRVVKAFGREEQEEDRYIRRSREGMRSRLQLALDQGRYGLFVGLTTALGTAAVLWIGVAHVNAGALTLGELLLVMAYLGQLYGPLKTVGQKAAGLQSYLASAERVFSVLDRVADLPERPNARPLARASGAVTFRNVSFSYEQNHAVLHDISFEVPEGARVAILGRTGAGKTTILNLLTRFYDPDSGRILLDGIELGEYKLADLRSQFSIVLQEPVLFSTTIAENIAYARPNATEAEIVAAANLANAHDFITSLPEGYQTRVGERGMRLSGGERQRISLARAFLKDAPILLLDEPTSSVDLKTEANILEAIERLMRGRTTFIVAHRLNTLSNCDLRLELENGRLVTQSPASAAAGVPRAIFETKLAGHPAVAAKPASSNGAVQTLEIDSLAQAAAIAWHKVAPACGAPQNITALKKKGHSTVFRLNTASPAGTAVIAKRCKPAAAATERMIYENILPNLAVSTLRFYGMSAEAGDERCWLFLEDAGGENYSCGLAEHRELAGFWLGAMHSFASHLRPPLSLPDRGSNYYKAELRSAREAICGCLGSSALNSEHLLTLRAILKQFDLLETHWCEIARLCETLPPTLVHGDLAAKNARVRTSTHGNSLLILDWETVGWGVPAIDLAQFTAGSLSPNLNSYSSVVERRWAGATNLARIAEVGKIFRLILATRWETSRLVGSLLDRPIRAMQLYQASMADSIGAFGWGD